MVIACKRGAAPVRELVTARMAASGNAIRVGAANEISGYLVGGQRWDIGIPCDVKSGYLFVELPCQLQRSPVPGSRVYISTVVAAGAVSRPS